MAEYGGKQRNQLGKVVRHSESKGGQLQRFVDNRPQRESQMNLIRSIQKKPNNTGLPDSLKSGVENLSGYSMDDIKVHYNSDKPAQLNALAYAQGTDIHVAPGQEKHLPHEVWHVVQQKQGRVQPTVQMQGINVNDNEGLEEEASTMGDRAIPVYGQKRTNSKTPYMGDNIFQFKWIKEKDSPVYTWDKVLNGLRWYYNTDSGKLYYLIENAQILGVDFERLKQSESKEYSIFEWETAGWKVLKIDEENKVIPITEVPLFPGKEGLDLLRESGIIPHDKPEEKGIAEKYWWEALSKAHYPIESINALVSIYKEDIRDISFLQWINSEEGFQIIQGKIKAMRNQLLNLKKELDSTVPNKTDLEKAMQRQKHKCDLIENIASLEKNITSLEKVVSEKVVYMDPEARSQYLLEIENHKVTSKSQLADGGAFVMNSNKDIYSAAKVTEGSKRIHHSSFLSGVSVSSAGCLGIKNVQKNDAKFQGDLKSISDHSGHYQPGIPEVKRVCDHLVNDCNSPNVMVTLENNTDKLTEESLLKMNNRKLTVSDFLSDTTFQHP